MMLKDYNVKYQMAAIMKINIAFNRKIIKNKRKYFEHKNITGIEVPDNIKITDLMKYKPAGDWNLTGYAIIKKTTKKENKMNNGIYILESRFNNDLVEIMRPMKKIMIKGIGYLVVNDNFKITPEKLLNIAASMERQGIKEL